MLILQTRHVLDIQNFNTYKYLEKLNMNKKLGGLISW